MATRDEIIEEMQQDMERRIEPDILEIKKHIEKQKENLVIKEHIIGLEDITKRREDPSYLPLTYQLTENGVTFFSASNKIYQQIKDAIPKTITSLTIPDDMLDRIEELENYPNLTTLNISPHEFTKDQLDYLKNHTKIRRCFSRDSANTIERLGQEHYVGTGYPFHAVKYQGITITFDGNFDKDFPCSVFKIHDYRDLDELDNLIEELDIKKASMIKILDKDTTEAIPLLKCNLNDRQQIEELEITTEDYQAIEAILERALKKGEPLKNVILNLENRTDKNLNKLQKYAEKLPMTINYNGKDKATYEEFVSMRATIDWYKSLLEERNLSPAEKLMYAYDIIKSFPYKESNVDKGDSRKLHKIITTGNIVCVGYSSLLSQILNEEGIPTVTYGIKSPNDKGEGVFHQRILTRIDDDKYNIHGVYSLDATWDHIAAELSTVIDKEGKEQVRLTREEGDKVEKEYDPLALYRHFLIPYEDYETIYPKDSNPPLFDLVKYEETPEQIKVESLVKEAEEVMFQGVEEEEVKRIIKTSERPPLETMKELLTTVKRKEGYNEETINQTVEDIIEINKKLEESYQPKKPYFQTKTNTNDLQQMIEEYQNKALSPTTERVEKR